MTRDSKAPPGFRGAFRADDVARALYSEAAGIARAMPVAVAVPATVDDVSLLVRWARDNGHTLVPRGSGSSQAGGAVGPGVVVDLSRLRQLDAPDRERRRIRAESGVLRGEVARCASAAGLRFPVDPSSGEFCTIGGMAATNAAGPHSLQHGSTRRWVAALDCVFDDGSRATVRRGEPAPNVPAVRRFMEQVAPRLEDWAVPTRPGLRKDSSGYGVDAYAVGHDLVDLLVGSEGTLALFTAVELMLMAAPGAAGSCLLAFDALDRAVEAAVTARDRGASACELLDRTFLAIAAKGGHPLPVPASTEAVLLLEVEGSDAGAVASEADRLFAELTAMGATAKVAASELRGEAELWSFRHAASPALAALDGEGRLKSMQFIEDAALPPSAVAEYVRGVRRALEAAETTGVIFGHAGDAHIHVNPLVDVSDPRWRERVDAILTDVTNLVARLGGTLTGEHGDGRLRAPLLHRTWPPLAMDMFAAVKTSFDPFGVFNPGVKLPVRGQRAIDEVKYDPSIAPLPDAARRALELVERERGYARFRLDLV